MTTSTYHTVRLEAGGLLLAEDEDTLNASIEQIKDDGPGVFRTIVAPEGLLTDLVLGDMSEGPAA